MTEKKIDKRRKRGSKRKGPEPATVALLGLRGLILLKRDIPKRGPHTLKIIT